MKVFALKAYGHYGGGLAVVAANDVEEAKRIAGAHENSMWHVRYDSPSEVIELPLEYKGEPELLVSFETGE